MKHWEKRTGTIDDGGTHLVNCEVTIIQHNWRGWFITTRTTDPEQLLNFHHIKALGKELGKEFGFEEAHLYSYYASPRLWERSHISLTPVFDYYSRGPAPGFIVEREIHFGDSALSREDFLQQVEREQQKFTRDFEVIVKMGGQREAYADENDCLDAFEDPAPYRKAIEAFNEEMKRIIRVENLEIKVAEEHLRISAETHHYLNLIPENSCQAPKQRR